MYQGLFFSFYTSNILYFHSHVFLLFDEIFLAPLFFLSHFFFNFDFFPPTFCFNFFDAFFFFIFTHRKIPINDLIVDFQNFSVLDLQNRCIFDLQNFFTFFFVGSDFLPIRLSDFLHILSSEFIAHFFAGSEFLPIRPTEFLYLSG